MRVWGLCFIALCSVSLANTPSLYEATYLEEETGSRKLLNRTEVMRSFTQANYVIKEESFPAHIIEHGPVSKQRIVRLRARSQVELDRLLEQRHVQQISQPNQSFRDQLIPIIENGPSDNRIDLVFMGDGYTEQEKDKFVADVKRLTKDMFDGKTFESYLPLFNVYAVFRASNESGIGKNDKAKDTAYRLYRVGETLRAIMPGNKSALRRSCSVAPGCDYPIVVANDPHYGGLGGEFAITTSSPTSGTMVLRHELGHNFGRVGEEYDGGSWGQYFGKNYSYSLSSLKWKHWLSSPSDRPRSEPGKPLFLGWPWHALRKGPYVASFRVSNSAKKVQLRFSASGIQSEGELQVLVNDRVIAEPHAGHNDRAFHLYDFPGGLSAGNYQMRFQEQVKDGNNWLSNLRVSEYGQGYHFDPKHVGAYPVYYSPGSVAGYRSTHETCLMREMPSEQFCPVCQENNWLQFFDRVDVIDGVDVSKSGGDVEVTLHHPALGQFRPGKQIEGERLELRWFQEGRERVELRDLAVWNLPEGEAGGEWEVRAKLLTREVREDPSKLLEAAESFRVR